MSGEFLISFGWVLWLALILIFIIVEVFTLDFTFLMLAAGSVGGVIASLAGADLWVQILTAAVLSLLLLFALRPPLLRAFRKGGDPTPTNVDALIGLGGTVVKDFADARGQVKLANGEIWTSRLVEGTPGELVEGEKVVVTAIDGATAVVLPAGANGAKGKKN